MELFLLPDMTESSVLCALLIWNYKQLQLQYLGIFIIFTLLSIGPNITTALPNPLYMLLAQLPGLWRFAKPEAFFFIAFIALLCLCVRINLKPKQQVFLGILLLLQWLWCVRVQPEYPRFSQHLPSTLPQNWERRIFRGKPH